MFQLSHKKLKSLENNGDKMSKWVIYVGIYIGMCDIHISVDLFCNNNIIQQNHHTKLLCLKLLSSENI